MDTDVLAAELEHSLPTPAQNHLYAVEVLNEHRPAEARALLERYESRFAGIDPLLAYVHPAMTIRLLRRGLPLNLALQDQHWGTAATILERIAAHDAQVAAELAEANLPGFTAGLASSCTDPFEGLSRWLQACGRHAPGLAGQAVRQLPSGAVAAWDTALRKKNRRREIAPLVHRAAASQGPAAAEAQELIRRFPGLQRQE
ncbi:MULTISPECIES: hypothetical protein [unclassified Streptomyces]|uniref:hypothetical protein n=1 Tax=unclassified Streptomyces TaxID=2593676 RepID=UPI0023673320|nr:MULTISPECIES: hypothetical protein [unclassified Streptomyces]MDF3141426.1 hypothetical protein [Streptomyces sp. T21Q-yed]WDF35311.1 hypothetical protein PBV52_00050 [Streptomyces sp. T12]WDF44477.1 hypothetical protein PBV52_50750 [Streptomyces sp. T12]